MNLIIFYVKFNFRRNSTYKSTLKDLKRLDLGLVVRLLSSAKWANQCAHWAPGRGWARSAVAERQTKTNDSASLQPKKEIRKRH